MMPRLATWMIRGMVLAAMAASPAIAFAEAPPVKLKIPPQQFKDLPGVKAAPLDPEPEYQCRTVTRQTDHLGDIDFLGRSGMPYLVYQCEKGGLVYEGTQPPRSWQWIPGINPQTLPDH